MNKEKVYLKGYVVGHAADTLGYRGLMVQLENLDIVEIDKNLIHKDIDEPQLLKLKDVIARIKGFDIGTRKVWLDGILGELGSDYGTFKYKQGYDQGKLEGEWVGQQLKDADKIRQELNKPVVPQFVADWYENNKDDFEGALFRCIDLIPSVYEDGDLSEFESWVIEGHTEPFKTLVNMHQFGYTVEKEKRYLVKMKGMASNFRFLKYNLTTKNCYMGNDSEIQHARLYHTRKELEDADFGWVFDCPGIEIEELSVGL